MSTAELPRTTTGGIDEVVEAAAAELAATTQGARVIEIGPLRLDAARSSAFTTAVVADTSVLRLGERLLTGLFVAESADSPETFDVVEAATWAGDRFELEIDLDVTRRAELFAPDGTTALRLFASTSDSFVVRSLHARLADLGRSGLAPAIAATVQEGRPLGRELGAVMGDAGRRGEMLAAVVERLASAGRRVLVVGSDNASLDRLALACHARLGRPGPGRLLRMGVAASAAVGRERGLTALGASAALAPSVVARLGELDRQRLALEPAAGAPAPPPPPAPASAPVPATPEAVEAATSAVTAAEAANARAADEHQRARQAVRRLEGARARHQRVDEAVLALEAASGESLASGAGVGRLAGGSLAELLVAAEVATSRLDRRDALVAALVAAQDEARGGPGRGAVAAADRELARARTAHAAAERAVLQARAEQARLAGPAAQAFASVTGGAPSRRPDAPGGAPSRRPEDDARRELADAARAARAQLKAQTDVVVAEAQVLLCTWGQFVGNPAIFSATYDEVVVDHAASVPAAWSLWAASRARQSLILGYADDESLPEPALPTRGTPDTTRRWVAASLPALVGLGDAAAVARHPGGLVLD